MATHKNAAASANREREHSINRLTEINGIRRKTAEALYQIGIHSYADLVQYLSQRTAREVSAALRDHGVNRPPAFIDSAAWARQARELGALEDTAPALPEQGTTPAEKPKGAPSSRDSGKHDAVFSVSFDLATDGDREPVLHTTVCDGTNGGQARVFEGSDTAPWVDWILERAHLPVDVKHIATGTEAVSSPAPVEPGEARLEIGDVQLSIIEPTNDGSEKRLKAEISFQLSGAGAETLASRQIPFRIEGYTLDAESGVLEMVASERSQLVPQVFEYFGRQEFGIPDVGRYEFHNVVLLLPPGEIAAYHRGPTMQVVP